MNRITRIYFTAFAVFAIISIIFFSCRYHETELFPQPATGCVYYTPGYELPQTQSKPLLAEFLSTEHFEYDLDGWFFFGSLVDSAAPDDIGGFLIGVQRIKEPVYGFRIPVVPAIVAFNNKSLGHYEFRGFFTIDVFPLMTVNPDPWSVKLNSPFQSGPLITMGLVSGTMGDADAVYSITADIPDADSIRMQVELRFRDRLGAVNEGDGPASFFVQFLTDVQRQQIMASPEHTVSDYLEATGDPMSCQGSYYYSQPLMDVEQFSIMIDSVPLTSGSDGLMWMDYVVQTYDQRAGEVFKDASWEFFAIQLPEQNAAIMVIQITSATGSLPVAKLFRNDSERTRNGARSAIHSWAIDEISIEPIGSIWTSQATGLKYAQHHRIQLLSDDWSADLIVDMVIEDQEIVITVDTAKTIKYEGLATVEGMLDGQPVKGRAFVELQPVGHLK